MDAGPAGPAALIARKLSMSPSQARWALLASAAAICLPCPAAEPTTEQVQAQDAALHAVCFVDRDRGWAVGDHGLILGAQDGANKNAAKAQVDMFVSAINMYQFNTKKFPEKLEDLVEKPSDKTLAERWAGPYLDKSDIPVDPWDNPYKYAEGGKHNPEKYDVWSMGPDGDDGSDDDIGNW